MTVGVNSYGSAASVAALTPRFASNGSFDSSTRPTLGQVESWINMASATLNASLANVGFNVPVSQTDVKLSLDMIVVEVVADLVQAANSSGRFFTERALAAGVSPMRAVRKELDDWVSLMAPGLEGLGATRGKSALDRILFRDVDENGKDIIPIFQRDDYQDAAEEARKRVGNEWQEGAR
jgi:hypothetical protein